MPAAAQGLYFVAFTTCMTLSLISGETRTTTRSTQETLPMPTLASLATVADIMRPPVQAGDESLPCDPHSFLFCTRNIVLDFA